LPPLAKAAPARGPASNTGPRPSASARAAARGLTRWKRMLVTCMAVPPRLSLRRTGRLLMTAATTTDARPGNRCLVISDYFFRVKTAVSDNFLLHPA
jgi:hypothetical protein